MNIQNYTQPILLCRKRLPPNFVLGINNVEDIQPVDFFNHSCNPNAGFNGQIFLVAMRDIKKREQITFDYAMVLSIESYNIECLCGSENCRGHITGTDWKIPELQEKYKGYFQPYLEGRIIRHYQKKPLLFR